GGGLDRWVLQRGSLAITVHRSADVTTSLMRSVWINEKNMADHSAELEQEVEEAADSGRFSDMLMNTAVDESWIVQLQTFASGLPWVPDVPVLNAMHSPAVALGDLVGLLAGGGREAPAGEGEQARARRDPARWSGEPVFSPFTVLDRAPDGSWSPRRMAEDPFFGPLVQNLSALVGGAAAGDLGQARARALLEGDAAAICAAERALARRVAASGAGRGGAGVLWLSLCPAAGEWRDGWKWPLAVVLGSAQALEAAAPRGGWAPLVGWLRRRWRRVMRHMGWRKGRRALDWPPPGEPGEGELPPLVGVWPELVAGALQAQAQEPHLVQHWGPEGGPFGAGGAAVVLLDAARAKCALQWSPGARALGGGGASAARRADSAAWWRGCLRSLAARHAAAQAAPPALLPVGHAAPDVFAGGGAGWPERPSELWRRLGLEARLSDPAGPRPAGLGAFGSWWPTVHNLFADAGALAGCGDFGSADEGAAEVADCRWAIVGRLMSELRPWEDFVGSDTPALMAAVVVLAWLADEGVVGCEEHESEETGQTECECRGELGPDSRATEVASNMLELFMEIVLAGQPGNLQRLFGELMISDAWQAVYFCALQGAEPRRYLAVDRGGPELPPRARARLDEAARGGRAAPLEELLAGGAAREALVTFPDGGREEAPLAGQEMGTNTNT
ncbi:unnamed protein product, partial [Prorocentrum cordatum]